MDTKYISENAPHSPLQNIITGWRANSALALRLLGGRLRPGEGGGLYLLSIQRQTTLVTDQNAP